MPFFPSVHWATLIDVYLVFTIPFYRVIELYQSVSFSGGFGSLLLFLTCHLSAFVASTNPCDPLLLLVLFCQLVFLKSCLVSHVGIRHFVHRKIISFFPNLC